MATTNITRRTLVDATAGAVAAASLGRGRAVRGATQDFAGKSITVGTIDGELSNGVEAQMAAFEAATGATIELVKIPGADFATKVTADLASGVGAFDVIIEPFIFLLGHAAGGFYVPIDDYVAADETVAIDDFIPLLFDNFSRFDGKVWALPYKADAYIFFRRKDLFGDPAVADAFAAQNGGAALKVPETADELVATARFFTKAFNPASPTEFGWSHMAMAGGSATWIWASAGSARIGSSGRMSLSARSWCRSRQSRRRAESATRRFTASSGTGGSSGCLRRRMRLRCDGCSISGRSITGRGCG